MLPDYVQAQLPPPRRRRPPIPSFEELAGLAPRVGPDLEAALPPPNFMQPIQHADFGDEGVAGFGLRELASMGTTRALAGLMSRMNKPPSGITSAREASRLDRADIFGGNSPFPAGQFGRHPVSIGNRGTQVQPPFGLPPPLPRFGRGGRLRKPGEVAVVGEEGPELLVKRPGDTLVIPLGNDLPQHAGTTGALPAPVRPVASLDSALRDLLPPPAYVRTQDGPVVSSPANPDPVVNNGLPPPQVPRPPVVFDEGAPLEAPPKVQRRLPAPDFAAVLAERDARAANPVQSRNSKLKSFGLGLLRGAPGGIPGMIASGVAHLADDTLDEQYAAAQDVGRYDQRLGAMAAGQKVLREQAESEADIALKGAQTEYARRRPDLEAQKNERLSFDRGRAAIYRELGYLKGQKLDPQNPIHADFLRRAAQYNVFIDPDSWNNSSANVATIIETDPDDPTKTNTVAWNKVTNARTPLGQKGFQAPRDPESQLTENERRNLELGGERVGETKRHNRVTESQGGERLAQGRERVRQGWEHIELRKFDSDRRLSAPEKAERGKAYTLISRINALRAKAQKFAAVRAKNQDTGEVYQPQRTRLAAEEANKMADDLEARLNQQYGHLKRTEQTLGEYRENHPELKGVEDWQVEEDAFSNGIQIVDYDSSLESTPQGPRRLPPPKPAAPAASAAPALKGRVSRAKFRAQNPQYKNASDADVDRVLLGLGLQGY